MDWIHRARETDNDHYLFGLTFVYSQLSTMVFSIFGLSNSQSEHSDDNESASTGSASVAALSQFPKMKWGVMNSSELIREKAHERVYDKNCTTLFKNIEQEEWGSVTCFLKTGLWPGAFFADSSAPSVQARTWVNRFDPDDPDKLKWSQLPLQ